MKKKGTTFIEIVVAITIFLIAIIPVLYLTLNSLRGLKKASEVEDRAKVVTTVVNYIKSRGYSVLLDGVSASPKTSNITWDADDIFSATYKLAYDNAESAYVVVKDDGTIPGANDESFEYHFFGQNFNTGTTSPDALFLINSLGVELEGAELNVAMKQSDLYLQSGGSDDTAYINPLTSTSNSGVIIGTNGLISDKLIFGKVSLTYTTKSDPTDTSSKSYEQNFVIVPLENFNH